MNTSSMTYKSFIPIQPESHFPLQNLPWGVFKVGASHWRIGLALGEDVIDLNALSECGLLPHGAGDKLFKADCLNHVAAQGPAFCRDVRKTVQDLFREDNPQLRDQKAIRDKVLYSRSQVTLGLPFKSGGYTDFYSSIHHATNVGKLFRDKNNPLLPNWKHLPVAYNGRASTLVPTGTGVRRPYGQVSPGAGEPPKFQPSAKLDYELELGYYIGASNPLGEAVPVANAEQSIFGFVLVNDWSARDIQSWEYVPLGPFLSKSFATSVSPWVVTKDALSPFKVPMEDQDPKPLNYLREDKRTVYDIRLEIWLEGKGLSGREKLAETNAKELYWSFNQQIAHHTINGCRLEIGDLMASGTISGKNPTSLGCLLESTLGGTLPFVLSNGEKRCFLEDHDIVTMVAYAQGEGYRIGFGEVSGEILPARKPEGI